jgi:DNA-binding Lrp family transcriptional regulator
VIDLLATMRKVDLADDAKFLNFSSNAEALVTPPFANALKSTAEALAADVRAALKPADFGSHCTSSDADARACATTLIERYGQKAFRRPLAQEETDGLLAVYDAGRETGTDGDVEARWRAGVDYTLRAMLQSPSFVYRIELGDPDAIVAGVTNLTPYEVASALSYMIVASPPDDALLAAAAAGELASPEALDAQARRLVAEMPERFAAQQRRFVREWLAIDFGVPAWDKNTDIYPLYTPELKSAIDQETDLDIDDWVAQGPTLTSLLTRSETFVNAVNAPLYGLTADAGPMSKVALDPEQRSGILTMPAFLGTRAHSDSSAPILRGISIVRDVMCLTIPPPPPNVPQLPPVSDTSFTTTRDRVEKHVASGACPGCHARINPLGYPFERYDGLGVYRTTENGYDVDPSGAIVGTAASDRTVADAIELTAALTESPEVQECFSRQVFRYTFGRQDSADDECTLRAATEAYRAKQLDERELLFSLIASPTFAQRSSE